MTKYRLFYIIIVLFLISNCTPTKLTYINFGDEKISHTNPNDIKIFDKRLDINSEFSELGVIIIEGKNEPNIEEVRLLASENGADGIIKEGKNFVLIKILSNKEKEIKNVYEYKNKI